MRYQNNTVLYQKRSFKFEPTNSGDETSTTTNEEWKSQMKPRLVSVCVHAGSKSSVPRIATHSVCELFQEQQVQEHGLGWSNRFREENRSPCAAPDGISCLAFALALGDNFLFHLPLHFYSWEAIQLFFCIAGNQKERIWISESSSVVGPPRELRLCCVPRMWSASIVFLELLR